MQGSFTSQIVEAKGAVHRNRGDQVRLGGIESQLGHGVDTPIESLDRGRSLVVPNLDN